MVGVGNVVEEQEEVKGVGHSELSREPYEAIFVSLCPHSEQWKATESLLVQE